MKDVESRVFTRLDPMHHILSGFKSLFSSMSLNDAEEARRCCGGAGYQSNSGFTNIIQHINPIVTYEGENTVMTGQASRYLMKLIKKVQERKKVDFPFQYLNDMQSSLSMKNKVSSVEDFKDLDLLDRALQVRACYLIQTTM